METEAYIHVEGNKFKIPYTRPNGRKANRYYIKVFCSVCGNEMYQHQSNNQKSKNATCSNECNSKLKTAVNGTTKRKRGKASKSNVILVKVSDHPYNRKGWVLEHRLVMEKRLKRYLLPSEVVHHINMVDSDNQDSNLFLCKSNVEHNKVHASLNLCVKQLIDENKLGFIDGKYYVK